MQVGKMNIYTLQRINMLSFASQRIIAEEFGGVVSKRLYFLAKSSHIYVSCVVSRIVDYVIVHLAINGLAKMDKYILVISALGSYITVQSNKQL